MQVPHSRTFKQYHYHFKASAAEPMSCGMYYTTGLFCFLAPNLPLYLLFKRQPTTVCLSCVRFLCVSTVSCEASLTPCLKQNHRFFFHQPRGTSKRPAERLYRKQTSGDVCRQEWNALMGTILIIYCLMRRGGGPQGVRGDLEAHQVDILSFKC